MAAYQSGRYWYKGLSPEASSASSHLRLDPGALLVVAPFVMLRLAMMPGDASMGTGVKACTDKCRNMSSITCGGRLRQTMLPGDASGVNACTDIRTSEDQKVAS